MSYCRSYVIRDFAKVAAPLYALMNRDRPKETKRKILNWGPGKEMAFQKLKILLTCALILAYARHLYCIMMET